MSHYQASIRTRSRTRQRHLELEVATCVGGLISPLLANIYLSVLDRHFQHVWEADMSPHTRRQQRRRKGLPNYRLVRYADLCGCPHRSAYAELRIMPTVPVNLQVRGVSVAGRSA
jgi:hypothetical protein